MEEGDGGAEEAEGAEWVVDSTNTVQRLSPALVSTLLPLLSFDPQRLDPRGNRWALIQGRYHWSTHHGLPYRLFQVLLPMPPQPWTCFLR